MRGPRCRVSPRAAKCSFTVSPELLDGGLATEDTESYPHNGAVIGPAVGDLVHHEVLEKIGVGRLKLLNGLFILKDLNLSLQLLDLFCQRFDFHLQSQPFQSQSLCLRPLLCATNRATLISAQIFTSVGVVNEAKS